MSFATLHDLLDALDTDRPDGRQTPDSQQTSALDGERAVPKPRLRPTRSTHNAA